MADVKISALPPATTPLTGAELVPIVQSGVTDQVSVANLTSGRLVALGSLTRGAPVTKTVSFTLADTENWVVCNGTGTITVTLPAAASWTGREVMIKTIAAQTVVSASSNVLPLASATPGTAILAATAGKWATLVSDGTNWVVMAAAWHPYWCGSPGFVRNVNV